VGKCGLDTLTQDKRPVTGSCEHCNEPLGSIKGRDFLTC
jgi:hypothetical protein